MCGLLENKRKQDVIEMYLLPYRETPRHLESKVQLLQRCHLRFDTVCHGEIAL